MAGQQKVLSHFPVCCWIDWLLMIKNCLIESGPPCIFRGQTQFLHNPNDWLKLQVTKAFNNFCACRSWCMSHSRPYLQCTDIYHTAAASAAPQFSAILLTSPQAPLKDEIQNYNSYNTINFRVKNCLYYKQAPWSESASKPQLVGEVSANFCGQRMSRGQRHESLQLYSWLSRQELNIT
jgi:hypothetical protein